MIRRIICDLAAMGILVIKLSVIGIDSTIKRIPAKNRSLNSPASLSRNFVFFLPNKVSASFRSSSDTGPSSVGNSLMASPMLVLDGVEYVMLLDILMFKTGFFKHQ